MEALYSHVKENNYIQTIAKSVRKPGRALSAEVETQGCPINTFRDKEQEFNT